MRYIVNTLFVLSLMLNTALIVHLGHIEQETVYPPKLCDPYPCDWPGPGGYPDLEPRPIPENVDVDWKN